MRAVSATTPRASVVIPTCNRVDDLMRVVGAVERQQRPPGVELEVVVVDDGSTDGTATWLDGLRRPGIKVVHQPNSGPARARNRGVEEAAGELILFLGDDTVPEPDWLCHHLEEHRLFGAGGSLAVVGYTTFPDSMDGPFSRFINELGAQFGYLLIERASEVPFNFLYTSNLSLRREDLETRSGFREDFPAAAWEDIEFAYRAAADGLRLRYQPRARTVHHHRVRPVTFCRRQRTSGRSAAIFAELHPELEDFLGVRRPKPGVLAGLVQRTVLSWMVQLGESLPGVVPASAYQRFVDIPYLRGLAEGLQRSRRRR